MTENERKLADRIIEQVAIDAAAKDQATWKIKQLAYDAANGAIEARRELFPPTEATDQARDATKVEPASPGHFDDALVERLASTAYDASIMEGDREMFPWAQQNAQAKERARNFTSAALAELASMPCELPTAKEIVNHWQSGQFGQSMRNRSEEAADFVRSRIAPILAAKDASLTHYRKSFEAKLARVAELEAIANESAQQYALALVRIAELEKQLAEATKVPAVDGKTPGQVLHETTELAYRQSGFDTLVPWNELSDRGKQWRNESAAAVLRAFGNGTEALRRVRVALKDAAVVHENESGTKFYAVHLDRAWACVDTEIANIEGAKT